MLDKVQLNRLYRYCYSLTVQRDDAYDLLQSTLEKYLSLATKKKQAIDNESAYLRRMIRNQFIDNARRKKCVAFEPLEEREPLALETKTLDTLMIQEELVDAIWALLNTAEREIIFLWAIEGYTAAEIAHEIKAPRGTVLSRIYRLRRKILQTFKEEAPLSEAKGEHQA